MRNAASAVVSSRGHQQAQGLFVAGKTVGEAAATALGTAVADEVLRSTLLLHEMGALEVEERDEGNAVIVLVRGPHGKPTTYARARRQR